MQQSDPFPQRFEVHLHLGHTNIQKDSNQMQIFEMQKLAEKTFLITSTLNLDYFYKISFDSPMFPMISLPPGQ